MFYAKSTGGFYVPEINGENIPADAVEISNAEHARLLAGQSEGKQISADMDGRPILVDLPVCVPIISVSAWQIRKALNQTGMRAAVEAYAATADQDTKDGWDKATEFREDDPLLVSAASALHADLHALLELAATL